MSRASGEAGRAKTQKRAISMPFQVLLEDWRFFRESAATPEITGRDKPPADGFRSGGLAA